MKLALLRASIEYEKIHHLGDNHRNGDLVLGSQVSIMNLIVVN